MFDFNMYKTLKAEGIREEVREAWEERIERREEMVREFANSLDVFLSPTTLNR